MRDRIHILAQQLLGKPSIEACTLQEVSQLAQNYPYFSAAQFLLLEKMKQDQDPGYPAQLQKSVLYYHNPVAFDFFINSDKFYTEEPPVVQPTKEELSDIATVPKNAAPVQSSYSDQSSESIDQKFENQTEGPADNALELSSSADQPPLIDEDADSSRRNDYSEDSHTVATQNPDTVRDGAVSFSEDSDLPEEDAEITDNRMAGMDEPTLPGIEKLREGLSAPANGSLPAFEPYHTVDYFASQGIKLQQEEAPGDKFGRQLKSFTEWLKTMKRIPAQAPADAVSENKVAHLAEDSVHDSSVVTEAMAEVWIKQGNHARAMEVYEKLSLLDPAKSAYFAAKIENLKSS